MVTFYGYAKCSTCRKAKALLQQLGARLDERDITLSPPPRAFLEAVVRSGAYTLPQLFNRSGELYRSLDMKRRLRAASSAELFGLLAQHGKLIKRPVIADGERVIVGFDEARIRECWGRRGRARAAGRGA